MTSPVGSEAIRLLLVQRGKRLRKKEWWKVDEKTGCWNWNGHKNFGYGIAYDALTKKSAKAHCMIYKLVKGKIKKGLCLDHLCRNRGCVNPAHLEQVTGRENTLRGVGLTAINAKKKKCKRGHAFTKANTGIREKGWRVCLKCKKLYTIAYYSKD